MLVGIVGKFDGLPGPFRIIAQQAIACGNLRINVIPAFLLNFLFHRFHLLPKLRKIKLFDFFKF